MDLGSEEVLNFTVRSLCRQFPELEYILMAQVIFQTEDLCVDSVIITLQSWRGLLLVGEWLRKNVGTSLGVGLQYGASQLVLHIFNCYSHSYLQGRPLVSFHYIAAFLTMLFTTKNTVVTTLYKHIMVIQHSGKKMQVPIS